MEAGQTRVPRFKRTCTLAPIPGALSPKIGDNGRNLADAVRALSENPFFMTLNDLEAKVVDQGPTPPGACNSDRQLMPEVHFQLRPRSPFAAQLDEN